MHCLPLFEAENQVSGQSGYPPIIGRISRGYPGKILIFEGYPAIAGFWEESGYWVLCSGDPTNMADKQVHFSKTNKTYGF